MWLSGESSFERHRSRAFGKRNQAPIQRFNVRCVVFFTLQKTRPYHHESDRRGPIPGAGGLTSPCAHYSCHHHTSTPVSSPVTSPPGPIYSASTMVNPAPYSGSANDCKGFLLQCLLALEIQPHKFPTERDNILVILSLLTGQALQWAESLCKQNGLVTQS